MVKIYICPICGNIITKIKDSGVPVVCCGKPMIELIPNKEDAAVEKHIPVYEIKDNEVIVKVGSVNHPMEEQHYIEWIMIETNKGIQIKKLEYKNKPEAIFGLATEENLERVYAYCNLHGLWVKEN